MFASKGNVLGGIVLGWVGPASVEFSCFGGFRRHFTRCSLMQFIFLSDEFLWRLVRAGMLDVPDSPMQSLMYRGWEYKT